MIDSFLKTLGGATIVGIIFVLAAQGTSKLAKLKRLGEYNKRRFNKAKFLIKTLSLTVVAIFIILINSLPGNYLLPISVIFGLYVGGTLSNFMEYCVYDKVYDYIPWPKLSKNADPEIANLADFGILVGSLGIVIFAILNVIEHVSAGR